MRIVVFYSFRGGTGRTTTLANVGVALARSGYSVCMVDLDLGAPGLARWPSFRPVYEDFGPALIDYLMKSEGNGVPHFRIKEVKEGSDHNRSRPLSAAPLWVVPTGQLSRSFVTSLEKLGWPSAPKSDAAQNSLRAVKTLRKELDPDFLLVDLPPGLGFGLNLIPKLIEIDPEAGLVFTSRPTVQSYEGLRLADMLKSIPDLTLLPVLTFVPAGLKHTRQFRQTLDHLEKNILGQPVRHLVPLIPELGLAERVLTAGGLPDEPEARVFWDLAQEIVKLGDDEAARILIGLRNEEKRSSSVDPQREGMFVRAITPASLRSRRLFLAVARLWARAEEARSPRMKAATEWLRCYLEEASFAASENPEALRDVATSLEPSTKSLLMLATMLAAWLPPSADSDHTYLLKRLQAAVEDDEVEDDEFKGLIAAIDRQTMARSFLSFQSEASQSEDEAGPVDSCLESCRDCVSELGDETLELIETLYAVATIRERRGDSAVDDGVGFAQILEVLWGQWEEDERGVGYPVLEGEATEVQLFPLAGKYEELSLKDALRWAESIDVSSRDIPGAANYLEFAAIAAALKRNSPEPQVVNWPRFVPTRGASKFETRKLGRDLWWPKDLAPEHSVARILGPLSNRTLVLESEGGLPEPGGNLPGEGRRVRLHPPASTAHKADTAYSLAPPRRPEAWREWTEGEAGWCGDGARSKGNGSRPLRIVIEDQGPGRALRDVLNEHAADWPRAEVVLESFRSIQRYIDLLEEGEELTGSMQPDILVVSQPRLERIANALTPVGNTAGQLISLNTGMLVYRPSFFCDPDIRKLYFGRWQDNDDRDVVRRRLRVPRTLPEVLEVSAFFEWRGRVEGVKGLSAGLGLQHGLTKEKEGWPDILELQWLAYWSEWSMLSRMLAGRPENHFEPDSLEDTRTIAALWRYSLLSAFAAQESWEWSWDALRNGLMKGNVAMALTWNDVLPLFEQSLATHGERGMDTDIDCTLLALSDDGDSSPGTPVCHTDGYIAVLLSDRKEAKDFLRHLAHGDFGASFAERGGSPIFQAKEGRVSQLARRRLDLESAALRYGVPRDQAPEKVKILENAKSVAKVVFDLGNVLRSSRPTTGGPALLRWIEEMSAQVDEQLVRATLEASPSKQYARTEKESQ